jgi:hemoglobin
MTTEDSPSLYDRLGGVYRIATVIDDFIDRIMVDEVPVQVNQGGQNH